MRRHGREAGFAECAEQQSRKTEQPLLRQIGKVVSEPFWAILDNREAILGQFWTILGRLGAILDSRKAVLEPF